MAYPYDDYGDLSEDAYDDLWDHLMDLAEEYGSFVDAREAFFEWAHEEYPDIDESDLWDVWRDGYGTNT